MIMLILHRPLTQMFTILCLLPISSFIYKVFVKHCRNLYTFYLKAYNILKIRRNKKKKLIMQVKQWSKAWVLCSRTSH